MEEMTFEKSLKELEKTVEKLESDDCSLEQSVKLYEKGQKLIKLCSEKLSEAEQKITVMEKEN